MRYIVKYKDGSVFTTDWYTYENNWNDETIDCVIDVIANKITFNGKDWKEIEYDHL